MMAFANKSKTPSSASSSTSLASKPSPPSSSSSTSDLPTLPAHCPPDVDRFGNHTWTFLHTLGASYPPSPTHQQSSEMTQFFTLFSKLYPCWHCAEDFRAWIDKPKREGGGGVREGAQGGGKGGIAAAAEGGQEGLSRWLCEALNEVNRKLGKPERAMG